jgi:polyvinyl alcohol dehydrogenase (cytochrome)
MKQRFPALTIGVAALVFVAARTGAATDAPEANVVALFEARCSACHGPGGHGPAPSVLAQLPAQAVLSALTSGSMAPQSAGLSDPERRALAEYVGRAGAARTRSEAKACAPGEAARDAARRTASWNGWSPDTANTRFQGSPGPDLAPDRVASLDLRWAFVFPDTFMTGTQPTVADRRVFVGSFNGTVYALDAGTGCVHWTFVPEAGVRAAVVVHEDTALIADLKANAYAVDAATGTLRWKVRLDAHPQARVTGAPTLHRGRLYVPVSSVEEFAGRDPRYACCTFRGSVVALDAATGREVWKSWTIDEPAVARGTSKSGALRYGPSGVAVWNAPTIDEKRGLLYVGTGNSYTDPRPPTTDAVVAIDLATGARKWVRSFLPQDAWNLGCLEQKDRENCPEGEGPDYDIGASPVLARLPGGRELLLAGGKAGVLYALDPDKAGAPVWELKLGRGGLLGGIEWGFAVNGARAYVAVSDWGMGVPSVGALAAVDLERGREIWRTLDPADACQGKGPACTTAQAAAVTVVPGIVFSGSIDGHLRAYDDSTGRILWDYDSARDFDGVGGVKGRGGSINAGGAAVADGMLFQTSGYSLFAMPGNVLLAFGPSDRRAATEAAK